MKHDVSFELDGKTYNYWRSPRANVSERCVEVSVGHAFLRGASRPIEVGNVTRLYDRKLNHLVIDLHEKHDDWKNYLNEDVLDWWPPWKPDRVLSISTLEHCDDPVTAIARVLSWAPEVLITIPLGYNCANGMPTNELVMMDHGAKASFLARDPVVSTGLENWMQVSKGYVMSARADTLRWNQHPEPHHKSAVAVCILRK